MKKISPFVGRQARIFCDGGWEFSGTIQVYKKDRIVLEMSDGDTTLIFREHISAVLLPAQQPPKPLQEKAPTNTAGQSFTVFKPATKHQSLQPIDDLSEGGVSLPHEVLIGQSISECEDNVFSSYFGAATDATGKSRLSVTLEEDDS
jgi:hypothetical protein